MKKNKVHKNYTTRFFRKAALSIIICFILTGLLFFVSCTPLNDSSGASGGNGNNTSGNSISTTEEETTETEENNNENPPPEETGENESGDI
ncbi:MAG: hypothetical protein PHC87_05690, partial [Actinomycetota bacterium]|nr:hypothetical protein [Actinomycetota bacterium]